ncbi:hypothetical protein VA596_25850 [Amycolatopsis sp., V23-08]|uniref:Lipoprotein n=1 Tax=Amycolatopsis heterodermiae TaxID=3110235 RepID=A0ABU5RBJ2_9PSEU|nr:hypothetical protein [Amycolatopsis sp., V23-08]MEA5362980.1 hypothetical protein [Amycolatopsis sp., V23-08]
MPATTARAALAAIAASVLTACGGTPSPAPSPASSPASGSEAASGTTATEVNPAGDIPDNQAYVPFTPPGGGFTVKIPEGWASSTAGATTTFTDKLNQVQVTSSRGAAAPTPESVTASDVPTLQTRTPNFAMGQVSTVPRAAGQATLLTYQGDSAPNPVTGKVVRDAFERYSFFHGGIRVDLTLSGPTNADNVDPWRTVTDSLSWS